MSNHDDETRLRHMLDAAKEACGFIQGKTRASLDRDRMLTLSLIKLIEIIGEAACIDYGIRKRALTTLKWWVTAD